MTLNTASAASTPLSPEDLLAIYDVPGASAAEFLCDRHDPDAVAFTVIEPDLSQKWVKTEFAAHAFPRTVHFVRELPKTPSGKIQRFLLRKERSGQA